MWIINQLPLIPGCDSHVIDSYPLYNIRDVAKYPTRFRCLPEKETTLDEWNVVQNR